VGDQKIESQHVVVRLAGPAPIDPLAVAQLVSLPRLADGQADEQHDKRRQEGQGVAEIHQTIPVRQRSCRCTTPSTRRLASITTIDVILRCSIIASASTAMVVCGMATGFAVMTSLAVRSMMLAFTPIFRRRSPSVMMPARRPSFSTTDVMPSFLRDIS